MQVAKSSFQVWRDRSESIERLPKLPKLVFLGGLVRESSAFRGLCPCQSAAIDPIESPIYSTNGERDAI